ncbi:tyrosine-type recombinase/integrase [Capnocytophaga gingivalis]|uniref:tyrosine-type recombinase/integrase n=1 Tax=Capnocytophaga gingivalis TaxID=1017 RepID=UPI002353BAA6|nr:tyrosine-type recombinase/integrase [Capnocytophaga gingivalis]
MITNTIRGCSYTELWVSPANWQKATKKDLDKDWYVQCIFFDPRYEKKYPKGFPYRKKANKPQTIEERKALISFLLKNIPQQFNNGYNPITKKYMNLRDEGLYPDLLFIEAFKRALEIKSGTKSHLYNIKRAIERLEKASEALGMQYIKIKDLRRVDLKIMLDYLQLPDKYYNKFVIYFSSLYRVLIEYECCESNITRDIYPKKTFKEPRLVLEKNELDKIRKHLEETHPEFYRYMMIFLYSGARNTELFRLQRKDVDLDKQEFVILLEKGGQYKRCTKVILSPALEHWKEVCEECQSPDDYLFSLNFVPSKKMGNTEIVTRFWKRNVKDKLGIEADFYALKHYMLDNLDSDTAMLLASHTNKNTTAIYQVNKAKKDREMLKQLKIEI